MPSGVSAGPRTGVTRTRRSAGPTEGTPYRRPRRSERPDAPKSAESGPGSTRPRPRRRSELLVRRRVLRARPAARGGESASCSSSSPVGVMPNTSRFSACRAGLADFGSGITPSVTDHASSSRPALTSCAAAIRATTGSCSRSVPRPSGDQPSVRMPRSAFAARSWSCGKYGCTSIWFSTGVTPVSPMIRSRWAGRKLETPIIDTRPSSRASTIARHASAYRPTRGFGQWISTRSSRSRPLRNRLSSIAHRARSCRW